MLETTGVTINLSKLKDLLTLLRLNFKWQTRIVIIRMRINHSAPKNTESGAVRHSIYVP